MGVDKSSKRCPCTQRVAFTLVELLAVLAVLVVLIGLLARGVIRSRAQARVTEACSNIRSLGTLLIIYASGNRDLPPMFLSSAEGYWPPDSPPSATVRGIQVSGYWFDHASLYHLAFDEPVPPKLLRVPGVRWTEVVTEGPEGLVAPFSNYHLTLSLYAEWDYWTVASQRGPSQWGPQRLGSIAFPSSKGLIFQAATASPDGGVPMATNAPGVRSAVLWADSSAAIVDQFSLLGGVPNRFAHYGGNGGTPGRAIATTELGVRGRDK